LLHRWLLLLALATGPALARVQLDEFTWPELRDAIAAGSTTVIVPVGGTEQSGAHLALGKHNVRVKAMAEQIATKLGRTLVAPVVAYVPEGSVEPPTQHMRWPGTISVPVPAFEGVIEGAARSLCHAGFQAVVLIGDHGGYQSSLQKAAARVKACRVIALTAYYDAVQQPFNERLAAAGLSVAEIGRHAGAADTSLMLAVDPSLVRQPIPAPKAGDGTDGDPRRASAELGRAGIQHQIELSVTAIRRQLAAPR
jgi:creatinine amidohydrolase/Fe(II)-dependent formamide hydrolase-like protein